MSRFAAPWDRQLRIASAVLTVVLLGVAAGVVVLGLLLSGSSPELLYPFLIAPVIILAVLTGAWLLSPRGFALESAALVVERRIGPFRIPLSTIRAVGALPEGLAGALRVGGNGGLFGYHGRFWSRRLGAFRLYATHRTGLVRVETKDDVFVLSPADPERFVRELLARAPAVQRETEAGSRRPLRRGRALRAVAVVALPMLALVGGIFAAIWGFAPIGAIVRDDVVRVERRWAPPVDLPVSGIRSAERLAPQYGRRWWRTNGTALGAVRYGRFASRELGPFRLYAWRYGPYVLLETDEGRVVLTPDEPEAFVTALRETLGRR